MSPDFSAIETALETWAETVTSLPAIWANRPRPHFDRLTGFVRLTPMAVGSVGQDYVYWETALDEDDLPTDNLVPVVQGRREFTVAFGCITRSQTATRHGRHYGEKLRLALKKPSTLEYFRANGIAVVVAGDVATLDGEFDGRWESVGSLEITFSYAVSEEDSEIGTIGTVAVSSTLKDSAGDVLPTPPNLDEEEITVS